ncbi:hypothetical protein MVES1_002885 [Malassezia vespertilionis]|uniref:Major allergen Mal f 1 n=1 Tax=Malassezia vespertilionis TaxID=2020962 RepID=A0A2N1J983_9BASI|nr:uncharacterized protein MVES1_002885 [Malassezia vespertilionis]PKI83121.1 hypothetical protein MVES_002732 [Malassezia vespertilionis]WFD07519.1 hypothetical protein MVES1_002885 [Malassezia vespertilionis]
MRTSALFLASAATLGAVSAALPDRINVRVKNLSPEDTVYDHSRGLFYQSNLWKGLIEVYNPKERSHINVRIDGVSSSGDGNQQMSGLSLNKHNKASRLYAVAKNANAFNFNDQKNNGPSSFHAFDLPLKESSKPLWSIDMNKIQDKFEKQFGTRPFGSVDSTQDNDGNSYICFALGMPAIAKVSPDGKSFEAWAHEDSNGKQRPGYSGIAYDPATDRILAYGGNRPLTAFNVKSKNPKAHPVQINGNFGSLNGAEKLTYVPVNGKSVLVAARAPDAIAFQSNDNWKTANMKSTHRDELSDSGFTAVTDYYDGNDHGIYASSAFFGDGVHGGRSSWPLYKLDESIMNF